MIDLVGVGWSMVVLDQIVPSKTNGVFVGGMFNSVNH
jgi:hypothetical protein